MRIDDPKVAQQMRDILAEQDYREVERQMLGKAILLSCNGKHRLFIETTPNVVKYAILKQTKEGIDLVPISEDNWVRLLKEGGEADEPNDGDSEDMREADLEGETGGAG